jgi:hypothetical protein
MEKEMVQADASAPALSEKFNRPTESQRIPMRNLLELHAREIGGLPDEWTAFSWEVKGMKPGPPYGFGTHVAVTGAVVTKRNRKGDLAWRTRDKSTEMTITIRNDSHAAWCIAWGQEHGVCHSCQGNGDEVASFGVKGVTYRTCRVCKGSGKPPSNGERKPEEPCSADGLNQPSK